MKDLVKRKDIFQSHIICSIYTIGTVSMYYQGNCNEIWRAKYVNRVYLHEYEDVGKFIKKINSIPDVYDIQSLAKNNHPVEAISTRKSFNRI